MQPCHHEPYTLLSQLYYLILPCFTDCTAILILDSDGNRILGKYYTPPHDADKPNTYSTLKDQKAFEKGLFEKTKKQSSDVILYDNKLVVYKQTVDATIYVVGGLEENEVMLYLVVVALRDCFDVLLKYSFVDLR